MRKELRKLVELVCELSGCARSGVPATAGDSLEAPSVTCDELRQQVQRDAQGTVTSHKKLPPKLLHVCMYFDEAHILADVPDDNKLQGKLPLDVFVQAINEFRREGLFTVLLSTQSNLEYVAPSGTYARSARYRNLVGHMHAPITETPFDCFDTPLKPALIPTEEVSNIAFKACFGRPLCVLSSFLALLPY